LATASAARLWIRRRHLRRAKLKVSLSILSVKANGTLKSLRQFARTSVNNPEFRLPLLNRLLNLLESITLGFSQVFYVN